MTWRVAVDVGGTFTDVVVLDEGVGEQHVVKVLTTPADYSEAFAAGIAAGLTAAGVPPNEVSLVVHGSTVATNAILESSYARLGLVVTSGFREMLEVGRQTVPGDFGDITWWIKPPRVVPLELVREVDGRHDHRGEELRPLDEEGVRAVARQFRDMGVDTLAVSLLHSYRNPAHEQRVRELVLEEHPGCTVSLSSDVIREYREYERTLSTCLNAGLMPLLSSYVARLEGRLAEQGLAAPLRIMQSSGGVTGARELVERPIGAVLSGPAAGVIGAAAIAAASGYDDVLTLDMGGTSTDIALVEGGRPRLLSEGRLDVYELKAPMIDMTAVGAGGGSVAWLTASRALRVGPRSAGSNPGPVCYGKGGVEPTVTDANLVLGRLGPALAGGVVRLDVDAANHAIRTGIAEPLGLTVERAAAGIIELAVASVTAGMRVVSVARGRDPRRFALVAFGGAGPLHACLVAEQLELRTILVPPSPGVTSAAGLLHSDVRADRVRTDVQPIEGLDLARLRVTCAAALTNVSSDLARQGFDVDESRLGLSLDLRYVGQAYELRVPLGGAPGRPDRADVDRAVQSFHDAHEDRYGFGYRGRQAVEVVNVAATGFGGLRAPALGELPLRTSTWADALTGRRPVQSVRGGERTDWPVFDRARAPHTVPLAGPAIVEQYDATIVVEPGWRVQLDAVGQLVLARDAGAGMR